IEASAQKQPGVRQAVASVRETGGDGTVLALHLVPDPGIEGDARAFAGLVAEVRSGLRNALPKYAIPDRIGVVAEVPLTRNGKVDRRALPEIAAGTGGTPPQGRLEAEVCRIFGEVLDLSVHGRDDSFFDLGGHSLAAMRAVSRISDELGVDVQAGTLMAAPTPAGLVAALQEPRGVAG